MADKWFFIMLSVVALCVSLGGAAVSYNKASVEIACYEAAKVNHAITQCGEKK